MSCNDKWDASGEASNEWDGTLEDAQALYEGREKLCAAEGLHIQQNFEEHCRALQRGGNRCMFPQWRGQLRAPEPDPLSAPETLRSVRTALRSVNLEEE